METTTLEWGMHGRGPLLASWAIRGLNITIEEKVVTRPIDGS